MNRLSREHLITAAAFTSNLGWGTILPYQYAYVVEARHWGAAAGVLTGTLFCVGAVLAAPVAGRLSDRLPAGPLATGFSGAAGLACAAMTVAGTSWAFLAAMLVFGATVTAAMPATQMLILHAVDARKRRAVFAQQFTFGALGMAVGALAAGLLVDLRSPHGMVPAFLAAALGFAVAAALVWGAAARTAAPASGRADPVTDAAASVDSNVAIPGAYRRLARNRQVRLLAIVAMLLSAGFYAQFETGLPAFALQSLHADPSVVGVAAAANCLVIVAVQWIVTRATGGRDGAALLAVVGTVWMLTWLLLEAALFTSSAHAGLLFVLAFGMFAMGETMYAPVLSPLAASVAPAGLVGSTLGGLSALRTGISAAGPLVAGVLLTAHLPHTFVLAHVAINGLAVVVAVRLFRSLRTVPSTLEDASVEAPQPRTDPYPELAPVT